MHFTDCRSAAQHDRVPSFARAALTAAGIASLGTLPTQLLSNQSVLIRADLHFGEAGQGLLVSAAFSTAALASLSITEFGERHGRRALTLLAAACTLVCALGVSTLAHSFVVLLAFICVGGVGNAGLTTAANFSLSATVAAHRQGLGFGVKQSAPPAAALIAGLAVPAVGLWLGWRWTYAAMALAALALLLSATRIRNSAPGPVSGPGPVPVPVPRTTAPPIDDSRLASAPRSALLLTAAAMFTANGAAMSLVAFLPQWAHEAGLGASVAGLFVAAGSALAIAGRLLVGFTADRRDGRNLPVVCVQMAVGSVGLAVLALGQVPSVILGGLLAFAIGWSWPGLLIFAVVRLGRDRPNSAAAVVQAGAFAGGGFGPLFFGLVAGSAGYPVAWFLMAAGMASGAVLLVLAQRQFTADLRLRPLIRTA
jgi:predicted MFS family arabinose efflux permease